MREWKTRRSGSLTSGAELCLILVLCACLAPHIGVQTAAAQSKETHRFTLITRGVPLGQALEELAGLTQIDLFYTSELVSEKTSFCTGRNLPAEELLECVLDGTGLDYVRSSSGTYILIRAVRDEPARGHLAGRVIDGLTGAPLPNAGILLADASTGTTTDEEGLFNVSPLIAGKHRLIVSYVGYETGVDSVWIDPGESERITLRLQPKAYTMDAVIVDGIEQRLPSSLLGVGELWNADLIRELSSGTPDVSRAATTVVGVTAQQPVADLHIQGGATGEHLMLLDGAPIRDPVNLGRHLGAFSPPAIKRLSIHKAGFGVEHGSHLSGVLAVEHDLGVENGRRFTLSLDPVSFNSKAKLDFDLPGGRRTSVMGALRTSTWDVYRDPGITSSLEAQGQIDPLTASLWINDDVYPGSLSYARLQPDVSFLDAHGAVRVHLSPYRILNASIYVAENNLGSNMLATNESGADEQLRLLVTNDRYEWVNTAAQAKLSWILGARSVASVQAVRSTHTSLYSYQSTHSPIQGPVSVDDLERMAGGLWSNTSYLASSDEKNEIDEFALKGTLNNSFSTSRHIEVGASLSNADSRFWLGNYYIAPFYHHSSSTEWAGYAKLTQNIGLKTVIEPGVRLTYLPSRNTVYSEPRLSIRYDGYSPNLGAFALRFAAGLYRQFTNQFELTSSGLTAVIPSIYFWLPLNGEMAPPRVLHFVGESLFRPTSSLDVRLEMYYKHQSRLLMLDYAKLLSEHPAYGTVTTPVDLDQSAFVSASRGEAAGASVDVRFRGSRINLGIGYGYSYAVRQFPGRFDSRLEPVVWNQPHRLTFDAELALNEQLSASLNGRGIWGRSWGFRRSYYDHLSLREQTSRFYPYDLNDPSRQILPPLYLLDAGIAYTQRWDRAIVQARVYVANLLNRKNAYDWSLDRQGDVLSRTVRTLNGRYPVFSIRLDI